MFVWRFALYTNKIKYEGKKFDILLKIFQWNNINLQDIFHSSRPFALHCFKLSRCLTTIQVFQINIYLTFATDLCFCTSDNIMRVHTCARCTAVFSLTSSDHFFCIVVVESLWLLIGLAVILLPAFWRAYSNRIIRNFQCYPKP